MYFLCSVVPQNESVRLQMDGESYRFLQQNYLRCRRTHHIRGHGSLSSRPIVQPGDDQYLAAGKKRLQKRYDHLGCRKPFRPAVRRDHSEQLYRSGLESGQCGDNKRVGRITLGFGDFFGRNNHIRQRTPFLQHFLQHVGHRRQSKCALCGSRKLAGSDDRAVIIFVQRRQAKRTIEKGSEKLMMFVFEYTQNVNLQFDNNKSLKC